MNPLRENAIVELKGLITDKTATNIEKSIYNWVINFSSEVDTDANWGNPIFCHIYTEKYVDVLFYLKEKDMLLQVNNKEILSKDVASIDFRKFNEERWKPIVHESKLSSSDGIFQCKKCKSKKTTYYSLQTRSADEPMTNFITCLICQNRWKM
jgi:DNA-directed RNA polymerase subunit M/transcription elongation factor TFIIS